MASYNPNIPWANDDPGISQGQMLTNFGELNTLFNVDHVQYNDATVADRGKHRQITVLNSAVAPVTGATEGGLYILNSGAARQYGYYRREANGVEIPYTMIGGFAHFTGAGALSGSAFNLTAVRTAAGRYTVTFTNPMVDGNYVVATSVQVADAVSVWSVTTGTHTVNDFTVKIKAFNDTFNDPTSFGVIVYGEIA